MRLPDPRRSRVVLIGTSQFTDDQLQDLPAVRKNVADLAWALTDSRYGIVQRDHCSVIMNEGDIRELGSRLGTAIQEAEDLLLIYYAGHGLIGSRRHELYLALQDSVWMNPEFSSLEYAKLRDAVLNSPAVTKVVILDCCFSGRAFSDALSPAITEVLGQIEVAGTYVLTSAERNEVALVLPGEQHTAFTGRMLRVLRDGVPGGPELLTIDDLYQQLLTTMRAEGLSVPQRRATHTANLLALGRNRFVPPVAPTRPSADLTDPPEPAGRRDDLVEVQAAAVPTPPTTRSTVPKDHRLTYKSAPAREKARAGDVQGPVRINPLRPQDPSLKGLRVRERPARLISAPRHRVTPGSIVVSRSYTQGAEPESGIYIRYPDDAVALIAPGGKMPDVSPGGDWISYVEKGRKIWLTRPDGSLQRPLATLDDNNFTITAAPRWSPDGRYLAFPVEGSSSDSDIFLLDVASRVFSKVSSFLSSCIYGPVAWTAEGQIVAVERAVPNERLVAQSGGHYRSLLRGKRTSGEWIERFKDPAHTPGGRIIFVSYRTQANEYVNYRYRDADSSRYSSSNQYSVQCTARGKSWRPRSTVELFLSPPDSGAPSWRSAAGCAPISSPRMLSDNSTIIYISNGKLYSTKIDGSPVLPRGRRWLPAEEVDKQDDILLLLDHAVDAAPITREWNPHSQP